MRRMKEASHLFVLLLLAGGAWVGLSRFLPNGRLRSFLVIGLGIGFVGVYFGLLITRIRKIYQAGNHLWRSLALLALDLAVLILSFAWIYRIFGMIDNTRSGQPTVHQFALAVYYSIVTFTTVGYGDFYPIGLGRAAAALEGLLGYLVLGVIASTAVSILSPYQRPDRTKDSGDS